MTHTLLTSDSQGTHKWLTRYSHISHKWLTRYSQVTYKLLTSCSQFTSNLLSIYSQVTHKKIEPSVVHYSARVLCSTLLPGCCLISMEFLTRNPSKHRHVSLFARQKHADYVSWRFTRARGRIRRRCSQRKEEESLSTKDLKNFKVAMILFDVYS